VGTGHRRAEATGVPAALARRPLAVLRSADAAAVYAHPRPEVARLARRGLLHRLAHGFYAVVPLGRVGESWRPPLEAAAAGIAAAAFGWDDVVLMGLSAARVHGVVPRALAVAVVAVPRQRQPLALADRDARVLFVRRDTRRLDAERVTTELGPALVTGPEQTVLDLAHRPELGGAAGEAREAAVVLLPRCDPDVLERLARGQRLGAALRRARGWAG
jgi:predicted transcriptional regulator of viral defense system